METNSTNVPLLTPSPIRICPEDLPSPTPTPILPRTRVNTCPCRLHMASWPSGEGDGDARSAGSGERRGGCGQGRHERSLHSACQRVRLFGGWGWWRVRARAGGAAAAATAVPVVVVSTVVVVLLSCCCYYTVTLLLSRTGMCTRKTSVLENRTMCSFAPPFPSRSLCRK